MESLLGFLKGLNKKSPHRQRPSSEQKSPHHPEFPEGICRQFSIAEIKATTNNFHGDLIIGHGRFGEVYKGRIDDGRTMVAVKRYRRIFFRKEVDLEEFRNEVLLLCQLRHPNLISLIGVCLDKTDMFVVYEYMSRGSLDSFLFGNNIKQNYLSWKDRLQICIGAARGLHYLHTGAKNSIIHRYIMSTSIVLDDECCGKLTSFGWSKRVPRRLSKSSIRLESEEVLGPYLCTAPEYVLNGELTEKSDVFSFGVVLFDVLSGGLPEQYQLLNWDEEFVREGNIYRVIDLNLKRMIAPDCLEKYLEIARSCVKHNPNERPDMGEVEVTLELALELQEEANEFPNLIGS